MILCFWLGLFCSISGQAIVHDGDTMRVAGYSVRLAGVDAEELSEPNGYAARDALRAIVRASTVRCEISGKSYNRVVGTCYLGDMDINAEIIRRGYALDCARYSGGKYRTIEPFDARRRLLQKPYCQ